MANDESISKNCTKCGQSQPVGNFGRRAASKDGLNPWCRACKSRSGKAWYEHNRETKRAQNRAWTEANREKVKQYAAAYYQAHKKHYNELNAAWARRHPERRAEWSRNNYWRHRAKRIQAGKAWQAANSEWVKAYRQAYRKRKPDLLRALSVAYKARKRGAEGKHTAADLKRLQTLQRWKCAACRCSIKDGYHVDHVIPLTKGGSNWPHNLQLLCRTCNIRKHNKDPIEFAQQMGRLL